MILLQVGNVLPEGDVKSSDTIIPVEVLAKKPPTTGNNSIQFFLLVTFIDHYA